jgi:pimeloyl-ACP methyl ester carboxylesterase
VTQPAAPTVAAATGAAKPARAVVRRNAGIIGTLVGVAAAGVAAGVAVERLVLRKARKPSTDDPYADEPFGMLPYDDTMTVSTADGIELHVEIVEPANLPASILRPTIVYVHGFCLDQGTFHFQRKGLDEVGEYRQVFYDQPGHGLSGSLEDGEYELPALGEALLDVIKAAAPDGPLVLVGHSMGGMSIMAAAEQHPELFDDRVIGVVLIATSAGQLDGSRFYGLPDVMGRATSPLLGVVHRTARVTGPMIDKARQASTDLAWLLTRRYGFGSDKPSPALVSYVETMNSRTTTDTVARYLRTINSHARYPALRALSRMPVLVIAGEKDAITPLSHSEEIMKLLPDATFTVIPEAGHVVMLEQGDLVNEALLVLLAGLEELES